MYILRPSDNTIMGSCSGKQAIKLSTTILETINGLLDSNRSDDFEMAKKLINDLADPEKLASHPAVLTIPFLPRILPILASSSVIFSIYKLILSFLLPSHDSTIRPRGIPWQYKFYFHTRRSSHPCPLYHILGAITALFTSSLNKKQ